MKLFATILSKLFEPMVSVAVILLFAFLQSGVSWPATLLWLVILIGPPAAMRVWARRNLGLDWDIKNRRRRILPATILLLILLYDLVLVHYFAPAFVFRLFRFFFIWMLGFLMITAWVTKISGHTAVSALAVGFILLWYGWGWWPVLITVPLVAWARVIRRDHTVGQVIAGAAYSWGLMSLMGI